MRTVSSSLTAAFVLLAAGILFYSGAHLANAADLPPGTRAATEADLAAMRAAGIPNPVVGMAWNPNSAQVGQAAGDAKQFLLTRQSCVNGAGISGEDPKNCILKLDASFATKLAELLKNDPRFAGATILSGYRSEAGEMRVSGKNSGSHRRGCAVDLVGGSWSKFTCGDACQYVVANSSRLKVGLPYYPRVPGEANHLEPAGTTCSGSPGVNPNDPSQTPQPPTSPVSNAIRQMLGMQQQPPPPPPPPSSPPQPSLPAQPSFPSQPSISSENPQVTRVSSGIISNPITTPTTGYSQGTISPSSKATSTYDLIDEYANPVSDSIDVGTAVSIALNDTLLSSSTQLQGTVPSVRIATGTVTMPGYIPQQIFTSGNLANNPVTGIAPVQNGAFAQLLTTFRNALLYALGYLRPFGG